MPLGSPPVGPNTAARPTTSTEQSRPTTGDDWRVSAGTSPGLSIPPMHISGRTGVFFLLAMGLARVDSPHHGEHLLEQSVERFAHAHPDFRMIIEGEHNLPGGLDVITDTVRGALAAFPGNSVNLFLEATSPPNRLAIAHKRERQLADPNQRARVTERLAIDFGHPTDTPEEVARFKQVLRDPALSIEFLNWNDPERRNISRALQEHPLIMWIGWSHALGTANVATGHLTNGPMGFISKIAPQLAFGPPEVLRELWNVSARSEAMGPTLQIIQTTSFKTAEGVGAVHTRERFLEHFANHTIAEVQRGGHDDVMFVGPQSFENSAREISEETGGDRVMIHGHPPAANSEGTGDDA